MAPKRKKSSRPKAEYEFKVGDLVCAKIRGHPLWPAKIEKIDDTNPNNKKYTVRFFQTNDIGENLVKLKLFKDVKDREYTSNKKSLDEARALCRQEYNNSIKQTNNGIDPTHEVDATDGGKLEPESLDGENNLTIDEAPQETKKESKKEITSRKRASSQVHLIEKEHPKSKKSRLSKTIQNENKQQAIETEPNETPTKVQRRASQRRSLPNRTKPIDNAICDENISGSVASTISSSNNDLKKENVAYDSDEKPLLDQIKVNQSLSKSTIDHNSRMSLDEGDSDVVQNPALEKLKKKLAKKMQEKETLKMIRLQKKAYERASKKFPAVYKKLDQVLLLSKSLSNKRIDTQTTATKLEDAHRNLETTLLKCIEKLTTDYGRTQKDSIKFQSVLEAIATNLVQVRRTTRDENPALSKKIKQLLKVYKSKSIREFINDGEIGSNSDDAMNERKENDAIEMS